MMPDFDKVLKALECCKNKTCDDVRPDTVCPYMEWSGEYETSYCECTERLAADALELLKAQEAGWISVKDRLPENADHPGAFCPRYQVMTKYGMTEGWYNPDKGCWYTLCWFLIGRYDEDDIDMDRGDIPRITDKLEVTHWMPLPEPPKEES